MEKIDLSINKVTTVNRNSKAIVTKFSFLVLSLK
jgi:hypothetical protein